jgi:tRNA pseudouridine55 synthase
LSESSNRSEIMKPEYHGDILTRADVDKYLTKNTFSFVERLREGAVILVDKPKGWTSFDVVNKIKKLFGIRKVGHAGTLDPLATGLLIVCTGTMTKEITRFITLDKSYKGCIKLGETTASYDADTDIIERKPFVQATEQKIRAAAELLTGSIEQIPPMYSAIKKNGKPLYKLARKGIEVERESRTVTVHEFEITRINLPFVSFRIRCSKGTYIRSIAHDIGRMLETGGHLIELRRTASGTLPVEDAVPIDHLDELKDRLKGKHA